MRKEISKLYINAPLKQYLDDLAARKPAPGGGSAAALAASCGAGLMAMVCNFTIGNPKYKDVETRVADILVKSENYRSEFDALIDKDVEAYKKVSAAKSDTSYKEALGPPLQVCRLAAQCLRLCKELVKYGNKNLVTDTAIAAIFLEGAFFAAKYNVYINLKYIKDMDYIGQVHKMLAPLEEELPKLKEEILEKCEDVIAK